MNWDVKAKKPPPDIPSGFYNSMQIEEYPDICQWIEDKVALCGSYVDKGTITLRPHQREILSALPHYQEVVILAPTQSGKSFLADMWAFYCVAVLKIPGCIAYCNEKTAREVLNMRIREMIKGNKVFNPLWSGKEDDLTMERLKFNGSYLKIASIENQNDLATWPYLFIIWSEVSKTKWELLRYNPLEELRGRQAAVMAHNRHILFESTPKQNNDCLYQVTYSRGSRIYNIHQQCPNCLTYQVFEQNKIQTRLIDDPGNIERIRRLAQQGESPCYIECEECRYAIDERERLKMVQHPVYAASDIMEKVSSDYTFVQKKETITKQGQVISHSERAFRPVFRYKRIDLAIHSLSDIYINREDAKATEEGKHTYMNNSAVKFFEYDVEKPNEDIFLKKIRSSEYSSAPGMILPEGILFLFMGIDTMGDYFKYVIKGFGESMRSWIVRYGRINFVVPKEGDMNFEAICNSLKTIKENFITTFSGQQVRIDIEIGAIDRGGHHHRLVDYIGQHAEFLVPYIGSSTKGTPNASNPTGAHAWMSPGGFFTGYTEGLSAAVQSHQKKEHALLPMGMTIRDMKEMLCSQYHKKEINSKGKETITWHHGREDHYADCLNYIEALINYHDLYRLLGDPEFVASRKAYLIGGAVDIKLPIKPQEEKKKSTETEAKDPFYDREARALNSGGNYISGGRW
jgi:phage terminase large subunit GpA-like protein